MLGAQVGGYRIIAALAEGGMGAVFIARHELIEREAVIKVLLPELSANQEMVRRFLNEARAATQIHHPGIVEIFDMGFLPSGQAYIAMERLRGQTLAARLRQGPMSWSQLSAVTRQLASALGAAHQVGIVHRDLKPDNLYLCADPSVRDPIVAGGERLKILDFGIAKLATGGGANVTHAGAIFGTPSYMSPEQCTSAGAVDHRSDLYAVGCILYEVATGRPPFGHGGIELIASHMRDQPADPRAGAPALPAPFAELLLRLLEKDPARRPQSCAELLSSLERAPDAAAMSATLMPSFAGSVGVATAAAMPTPAMLGERVPVRAAPGVAVALTTVRTGQRRAMLIAGGAVAATSIVVAIVLVAGGTRGGPDVTTPAASSVTATSLAGAPPGGAPVLDASIAARPPGDAEAAGAAMAGAMPVAPAAGGLVPMAVETPSTAATATAAPAFPCPAGMVPVPGATFTMGSPARVGKADERPQRQVTLGSFCLDQTEVTAEAYAGCVAAGACSAADEPKRVPWDDYHLQCNGSRADRRDHPVNCTDWAQASAYCGWAQKRLPTEAEWEYAAGGGDGRTYPWGNEPPDATRLNLCGGECAMKGKRARRGPGDDEWAATAPVGRFAAGASRFGALDLAGNVQEWTADFYSRYSPGAVTDPKGPRRSSAAAGGGYPARVLRGASWYDDPKPASRFRVARRSWGVVEYREVSIGFRCAVAPAPP